MINEILTKENLQILENVCESLDIDDLSALNLLVLLGFKAINLNAESNKLVTNYCGRGVSEKIKKSVTKKRSRKILIPAEWIEARDKTGMPPEEKMIQYALDKGFERWEVNSMWCNYVDHQIKSGNRWVEGVGWHRDWQGWVRRQVKFKKKGGVFHRKYDTMRPGNFREL